MPNNESAEASIRRTLRSAGLSVRAIEAAWPEWWSSEAESSLSATTELRYTLARRLGLSAQSLFEGEPKFVWRDETKFKRVATADEHELAILSAFGVAAARSALPAMPPLRNLPRTAAELRDAILDSSATVDLGGVLAFAWAVGIPVFAIKIFPLSRKRMHAMTARLGGQYVILIGRSYRFAAPAAFTLAHEIGHVLLQHVADAAAVIEIADPLRSPPSDDEESGADAFALELLTGDAHPVVTTDTERFNAAQLADAVLRAGTERRIDPGVLAMCLAYTTGRWAQAFTALKLLHPNEADVATEINRLAASQLDWDSLAFESQEYLQRILGLSQ